MTARVLVLGGGVAGLSVAHALGELGLPTLLVEKTPGLGGRARRLATTFPLLQSGFGDGESFVDALRHDALASPRVEVKRRTTLRDLQGDFPRLCAHLSDGSSHDVAAVVVATGFEPFDPASLEEYGYGRYPGVITASELEWLLNPHGPTKGQLLKPDGGRARRLAIVFCVGSRNRRIGAPFCSRICCSYSTKQALTVIDRDPLASVICFYMDVRTYDRGFEEMYTRAQERGIRYVRGRVASCKLTAEGSILVRAENTLVQAPLTTEVDLVSLSTGMRPCADVEQLSMALGIERAQDGFFSCSNWFRHPNDSTRPGVFLAGCATGMKPIRNCVTDAHAAAARVAAVIGVTAP